MRADLTPVTDLSSLNIATDIDDTTRLAGPDNPPPGAGLATAIEYVPAQPWVSLRLFDWTAQHCRQCFAQTQTIAGRIHPHDRGRQEIGSRNDHCLIHRLTRRSIRIPGNSPAIDRRNRGYGIIDEQRRSICCCRCSHRRNTRFAAPTIRRQAQGWRPRASTFQRSGSGCWQ